jgi:hypothetical protein
VVKSSDELQSCRSNAEIEYRGINSSRKVILL